MKNLAFASLLLVACTSPSPPKEAPREAAPAPTTSVTVEPASTAAAPPPGPTTEAACATDADCRTYSSYCPEMPCGCLALASSAATPRCAGPAVNCFVDPCRKKIARCKAGACVLASSP